VPKPAGDTRQRIIDEALRLFARQGYRGTTIAQIERAAGLSPGSSALYKHFKSKEELLAAGVERHVSKIEEVHGLSGMLDLGDLRAELTLIARWVMFQLDEQRDLIRILQKEGDSFPELLGDVRTRLVERAYSETVAWLQAKQEQGQVGPGDVEAIAVVALGSLINFRVHEIAYGSPPLGLEEERFVRNWVDSAAALARQGIEVELRTGDGR
jgi:AcrR family transcriptional regulator